MLRCKIFLIFLLILITFSIHNAFHMEEIVGGYAAFLPNHKFHAAIVGKYNKSNVLYLHGSASIINDNFLITAARCVVLKVGTLKRQTFFAVVGTELMASTESDLEEITTIYTYKFGRSTFYNDISLLKLKTGLNLEGKPNLAAVSLPTDDIIINNKEGIVAGYGIDTTDTLMSIEKREYIRLTAIPGNRLKYAYVSITSDHECHRSYSNINSFTSVCGIIQTDMLYDHRGTCLGDLGAPLNIDWMLVGMVSRRRSNCNDTIHGTVYTKIYPFKEFIDSVLAGQPKNGSTVHFNPPFVFSKIRTT